MAPQRRPNPIGTKQVTLRGVRSIDTKVIQGEVDVELYQRCVVALRAQGYTIREMVEWGCHKFLSEFGQPSAEA